LIIHQIILTRKYSILKLKLSERILLYDIMKTSTKGIYTLCFLPYLLHTFLNGKIPISGLSLESNIYSELAITLFITLFTIAMLVFIVDIPKQIKHEYPNLLEAKRT
jgi:hypothetical protein